MRAKFYVVVIAITLCATVVLASQIGTIVNINNQPIGGEVIEHKGRIYVAIDDVAKILGAKTVISVEPGKTRTIEMSIGLSAATEASGNVEGVVTYFFNDNFGSKPDIGSEVWIIKGNINIPRNEVFSGSETSITMWKYVGEAPQAYRKVMLSLFRVPFSMRDARIEEEISKLSDIEAKEVRDYRKLVNQNKHSFPTVGFAVVDGGGSYKISKLDPGKYTLIIRSAHRKFYESGFMRDSIGMINTATIEFGSGQTRNHSFNFGLEPQDK